MLKRILMLGSVILLFFAFAMAENTEEYETYTVRNGNRSIDFQYPSSCFVEDEDMLGVIVRKSSESYVAISIPRHGKAGTEKLLENIGDSDAIIKLSDNIHVFAVHGDENHHAPYIDIVEIGINLDDGTGAIINITCPFGETEIYEVAQVMINSITKEDLFDEWLIDYWLPILAN